MIWQQGNLEKLKKSHEIQSAKWTMWSMLLESHAIEETGKLSIYAKVKRGKVTE